MELADGKFIFLTNKKYNNLNMSNKQIQNDYGDSCQIADITDLLKIRGNIDVGMSEIGISDEDKSERRAMIQFYGNLKNGIEQYYIESYRKDDPELPIHESLTKNYYIRSWYNLMMPVLVVSTNKENEQCNVVHIGRPKITVNL